MTIIALDYDKTYTACPALWDKFIDDAKAVGAEVICCSMRNGDDFEADDVKKNLGGKIPLYFSNRKAKAYYLAEIGINPDIWIDDNPGWIFTDG